MLRQVAAVLTRWSLRWVPDAWIIAVVLTVGTFGLGLAFTSRGLYGLAAADMIGAFCGL